MTSGYHDHNETLAFSRLILSLKSIPSKNICITFIQCWSNVEDVRPTLYKCYTNVYCVTSLPTNIRRSFNVDLMLGRRRRRWTNNKSTSINIPHSDVCTMLSQRLLLVPLASIATGYNIKKSGWHYITKQIISPIDCVSDIYPFNPEICLYKPCMREVLSFCYNLKS